MAPVLQFDHMTKRFGAATVLDDVSLTLAPGRIHALMGENGAGKSTLIKLIAGVLPADAMSVRHGDRKLDIRSPDHAAEAGFRFIHQELNIVPQLSVAENILLGQKMPARFGVFVDWRTMADQARAALTRLGVDHIDPKSPAGALGLGDQMLVQLASALVASDGAAPCLYVLDEPTAALKSAETTKLFGVLRSLRDAGAAILYVSHRIAEIEEICDDVTVLRNGARVSAQPLSQTNKAQIVRDMTGKALADAVPSRSKTPPGGQILSFEAVSAPSVSDVSFELRSGEVLGLAGLAGAGQSAVLRFCLGLEACISGAASYAGGSLPKSPHEAWAQGVAYVPPERRRDGLMMSMGAKPNTLLAHLSGVFAKPRSEARLAARMAEQVKLKAGSLDDPVSTLSGGNQQKVVFARSLAKAPKLLLLDEPTRGVDVGARAEIYALIQDAVEQGCGCLLVSSDLPELIGLSDRILVLSGHNRHENLDAEGLTPETLLERIYAQQESRIA